MYRTILIAALGLLAVVPSAEAGDAPAPTSFCSTSTPGVCFAAQTSDRHEITEYGNGEIHEYWRTHPFRADGHHHTYATYYRGRGADGYFATPTSYSVSYDASYDAPTCDSYKEIGAYGILKPPAYSPDLDALFEACDWDKDPTEDIEVDATGGEDESEEATPKPKPESCPRFTIKRVGVITAVRSRGATCAQARGLAARVPKGRMLGDWACSRRKVGKVRFAKCVLIDDDDEVAGVVALRWKTKV